MDAQHHQENINQNHNEITCNTHQDGLKKKKSKCWQEYEEITTVKWCSHCAKTVWLFLKMLNSPVGLGLHTFTAEGTGSIPGWETKIPQAA